jgi:phosphatidylinositol kinase/protein kinase (PI-3  family)
MQAALGATGVEGAFRRGCEHIIRVARRHSTTLSSLLQSVLVDPLVTWLPDRDQAGTKKVCCSPNFMHLHAAHLALTMLNKRKRKDYAFRLQFHEEPSIIPGCPGHSHVEGVLVLATPTAHMQAVVYIHSSAALSAS